MTKILQRVVQAAKIDKMGVITAVDLLEMPTMDWGFLRDRITDRRNGKDGLSAKCFACGCEVYIRAPKSDGVPRPAFWHYSGGDLDCPWFQGRNQSPDDARADQYQGQQESLFHRNMCELVGELVALDSRYIEHKIAEYLPPTANDYGRYPDIYVEWRDYGRFAVEFQMSRTFQTEISARCKHYEREGIPLLWILFGVDKDRIISQSFEDVIRRHRGNAFILDRDAVAASYEHKTLMLSCFLKNATGGFDKPKIVRFDELMVPRTKVPFLEDRILEPRLAQIQEARATWFDKLRNWEDRYVPFAGLTRKQSLLIAVAFSIVATSQNRRVINFASEQNSLSAVINTYFNSGDFSQYSDLVTTILKSTISSEFIKPSVYEHIERHRSNDQASENSFEWRRLRELIPEALDPLLREEMLYYGAAPDWVRL